MNLNTNQKRAVEYLNGPLLVLAGPGTGKTQLLSEKVAYILKNTDTSAENILCLTFTDSGAKNMRERLKTIIGKDALKVNIGTYHAFGQDILMQYKNYSDSYDRILDTSIDEVTQYKIIKEIQEQLPGNDILRGDAISNIIEVISSAKSAQLSAEDLALIAKQNMEDSVVLSQTISSYLMNVVPRKFEESLNGAYLPIFELLKNHVDDQPIVNSIERSIAPLARSLKDAIIEAQGSNSITALTKWRNDNFEIDLDGSYRLKDVISNKKLDSISRVMSKYETYLRENGLFDYDDMIEEAVKVLKDDVGFRMTLQEKYQYILLDEFQDTNPSQFAIVKGLTDYEKPMVMAVGDDDQAIYEFQGALSSNLTDFQKHYHAEVIPLVDNYRSTQEILDFSREIINQADDRFADKELISHQKSPTSSQIYRMEFNSSDSEFGFVANEISKLIGKGVKQSEIAIISYKSKYFEPLLPFLKSYPEIKIAYEKRDNLFEDEKIHQLLTISRFVYEKAMSKKPTVQILEILSYSFFGLSTLDIVKLVEQARRAHRDAIDYIIENGDDSIKDVLAFLSDLAANSFTEPLEVLLFKLTKRMQIETLDDYARFRFYENLASLRGKLAKHFGAKALKLSDLVAMIDDYETAGMALNTTSPYRDAMDAVQVLTAHKAKGLEFEYVFIISADHTAWGAGKGNNTLLSLPKNLTQIRHTGMTDSERLRVLYVALTRAKHTLYITNSLQDFNGKSPERLEYFEEYVSKTPDGREEVLSPLLPSKKVKLMYEYDNLLSIENNLKNWLSAYLVESPDMRDFYKSRMSNFRMSASALTSFLDIIYGGPRSFFEGYVLGAPIEPDNFALALGNIMHDTFEQVTKQQLSDEQAIEYFRDAVSKYDTSDLNKQAILTKGEESLTLSLNRFGDIIRSGLAEVNFYSESVAIDGVPVTGKIDHIIVDDEAKTIEVFDYKTSSYQDGGWESHPSTYWYMMQLWFYKLLLNNSIKYRNYKVTRGHILYIMKNAKFGDVYDKVLDFDTINQDELLGILKAVYLQVTQLAFLDDPELFIEADKSRSMKQVREFIKLLLAKTTFK